MPLLVKPHHISSLSPANQSEENYTEHPSDLSKNVSTENLSPVCNVVSSNSSDISE